MATIDVVIPVLNEEHSLGRCIETLGAFLRENLPHEWRIVVADNGSTDATLAVATGFAESRPDEVGVIHLDERGRGRALKRAWRESTADVVSYMDVDLSTGLEAFPPLVAAVTDEGFHLAWGSRLSRESQTERSFKREFISQSYNRIIRLSMGTHFRDAQCGFKAMSRAAADVLLPHIEDNGWFFDTELLVIAEKRGFRWKEIPVAWEEDPDTRVKVVKTALDDLRGLARLRFGGIPRIEAP
ncbi:MAG: glycosyltransferase family 2 protein [Chloroflexi bacterium]|nr:glycosyltransferase family 2 protein [Chloroflexota bacterium]MYA50885.1 glycosyltransferase family 2 protein [Chloroflexota bacterium]MYB83207.1 glycosyltransferase family 2 protein [Chloroflexota bacterium]MYK36097.1 glycosyltransferase family 2 protein [Chloroflexota bacterium]